MAITTSQNTWLEHLIKDIPKLNNDIAVGIHSGRKLMMSEVIRFIFGPRIAVVASKQNKRGLSFYEGYRPGWVHIGRNKEDLITQKHTKWVRSVSTILNYANFEEYEYMTYATFNLSKHRKAYERRRTNLNSTHAIVIDIDDPAVTIKDIESFIADKNIAPPSFVNATPRGLHIWYVFEKGSEAVGPHESKGEKTKAGQFYEDINHFLLRLYQKHFNQTNDAVDHVFGGERYIRIPKSIVFWTGTKYTMQDLALYKKQYQTNVETNKKSRKNTVKFYKKLVTPKRLLEDEAYRNLLTKPPQEGFRRKTVLTISLLYKEMGAPFEQCITALSKWYETVCLNKKDFKWDEVEQQANSIYQGSWRLSPKWVKKITGIYPKVIFTKRKKPEERLYKTLDDTCQEFIQCLKENQNKWITTTRNAMKTLKMRSKNNLERVVSTLIEKGIIKKEVIGKGRSAQTIYYLVIKEKPINNKKNGQVLSLKNQIKKALAAGIVNQYKAHFLMPHFRIELKEYKRMGGRAKNLPGLLADNDDGP